MTMSLPGDAQVSSDTLIPNREVVVATLETRLSITSLANEIAHWCSDDPAFALRLIAHEPPNRR